MKFVSSVVVYLAFVVFVNSQTIPSCSYGTYYNGATCQDCGNSTVSPNVKIVGGVAAKQNSLPSQAHVRIFISSTRFYVCGGTLISRRTVMTAAHCVSGITVASNVKVYLGAYDTNKLPSAISASKIVIHSLYSSTKNVNDIALIHLSTAATLSKSVGVACLPQSSIAYPPIASLSVVASGWGTLIENGGLPNILQNVKLSVLSGSYCLTAYGSASFVSSNQICAGELKGGKDTCQGDSGGPLYRIETIGTKVKQVVSGVTSYGNGCARPKYPGVYTRVSAYLSWIKSNMIY